ncbi:ABC transporter permease [Mangrovibrevibacter kandeliae]|uniref:ABC transporter permease n=1 Tax=Mangrovibrevibacter kandeliae TaxID=2968473 RepID=UPI0021185D7F|nr:MULTISPECIES: ABC transporter permease [unclassified Aurantimonas]MCQ8782893.1 ABC transporter permease [Aurantimonas sp. CSK15Z-1]MCW4115884.1 ABC transporter permease [Aurantimonas sp. MSK8Z-1]
MLGYALWRLLQAAISVFGVITIVFVVMHFSGDPTLLLVPQGASAEQIETLRHQLGFDQPVWVQYLAYLGGLLQGDFGQSVVQRAPAFGIVLSRLPYTIELAIGALIVAIGVGLPVGMLMATYRGTALERALAAVVLTGQSVPTFLSGILLIMVFAVQLHWLPTSGVGDVRFLVMPSIALGALSMSTFARMTRIAMVDELGKDYVRAALARGLSMRAVVLRHVLRNSAIPVITIAALEIGNLLAGAVIVETVFAWPGIGQLAIQSIQSRDFLVVQVIVLLISFIYVATSVAADFAYAAIDPRIRLAR